VFPDGNTEYLHPKDGVFPEKVNEGRPYNGKIERNIGRNPNPATLKFTGKKTFDP
jgi:photosystem I subunit 2